MSAWHPTASIESLKLRARIIQGVRAFFDARDVLEVETPLLARFGVTDPFLENFETQYLGSPRYLQTSPEYHMKRLLCAGSPSIFQLSKAFRHEASGAQHNPEFTMLEWYRLGFDYRTLMDEVSGLIEHVLEVKQVRHVSYQALFQSSLSLCPFEASIEALKQCAFDHNIDVCGEFSSKDQWLSLLLTHVVEPTLGQGLCFVYDFPASQAALARIEKGVAKRFECYLNGVELANGFEELTDPAVQCTRFNEDNRLRLAEGLKEKEKDNYLLASLTQGLPACSGVALGLDRLLMLALDKKNISEVISFSTENA